MLVSILFVFSIIEDYTNHFTMNKLVQKMTIFSFFNVSIFYEFIEFIWE